VIPSLRPHLALAAVPDLWSPRCPAFAAAWTLATHARRMNLVAFQSLRSGLQRNATPATSQVRKVVEAGLREELLASGLFDDVEVGSGEDGERLLVALCTYRADVDDEVAAHGIERAWAALAFHHWQAHAFLTDDGHVEMQAATLDRPAGRYLTVHLVAQRAPSTSSGQELARILPPQRCFAGAVNVPALAYSA
jgi:hypothetical protein